MTGMTLELAKIRALRDQFVPETQTVVMDRAIDDLVASGIRDACLRAGDRVPDFSLPSIRGEQVNVRTLLLSGPIVLGFYRGSRCPYCNIELRALQQVLPEIERLGASIVAISPELPDRQVEKENALTFPVLTDLGDDVARLFGIGYELDEDLLQVYHERGHERRIANSPQGANTLALPAAFVVDQSGAIRLA